MNKARRWGNEESKTPNKTGNSGWQNIHTVMKTAALTGNFLRYNRKLTMDIVAMLNQGMVNCRGQLHTRSHYCAGTPVIFRQVPGGQAPCFISRQVKTQHCSCACM